MVSAAEPRLLVYSGSLNRKPANILVDSGASANFIAKRFVERHQIPTTPIDRPQPIAAFDGVNIYRCHERVSVIIQLGTYSHGLPR